MREVYQNEEEANVVDDTLEAMVREGARRMLAAALEEEVSGFLGRVVNDNYSGRFAPIILAGRGPV